MASVQKNRDWACSDIEGAASIMFPGIPDRPEMSLSATQDGLGWGIHFVDLTYNGDDGGEPV